MTTKGLPFLETCLLAHPTLVQVCTKTKNFLRRGLFIFLKTNWAFLFLGQNWTRIDWLLNVEVFKLGCAIMNEFYTVLIFRLLLLLVFGFFCGLRPQNKHKNSIKFITIMCILTYSNKGKMQTHICKLGAFFTLNWNFIYYFFKKVQKKIFG